MYSLDKTLLSFALLHCVLQGQICLVLQVFLFGYPTISFHCPSIGEKFITFPGKKKKSVLETVPIGLQMSLQLPNYEGLCGRQSEVKPRSGRR